MNYNDPTFLPPSFIQKIKGMIDENEIEDFTNYMNKRLRKCIRINKLKEDNPKNVVDGLTKQGFNPIKMPWYEYGYFIEDLKEKKIGNTIEHFLGKIYVQEASSMLPIIALNPQKKETILDLAASPGSKTTQIAMEIENSGIVIANEPQMGRLKALQENLERSGSTCHVITRNDGRFFKNMKDTFDRVLVDAPCSGEGTFRKDIKSRFIWNQKKVVELSFLQKKLLESAIISAKKDAIICYSTCTFSPEENELVVDYAVKNLGVELVDINYEGLNTTPALTSYDKYEFDDSLKKGVRVWPHKTDMEGFFIAKMIKK